MSANPLQEEGGDREMIDRYVTDNDLILLKAFRIIKEHREKIMTISLMKQSVLRTIV